MYEVAAGELNSLSRANLSALGQKQTFAVHQPMSALPPKADMCGATRHVRFGPIADIATYSITSSARASSAGGTVRPSALAVLRLERHQYTRGLVGLGSAPDSFVL